jgi:hypothetical protein
LCSFVVFDFSKDLEVSGTSQWKVLSENSIKYDDQRGHPDQRRSPRFQRRTTDVDILLQSKEMVNHFDQKSGGFKENLTTLIIQRRS